MYQTQREAPITIRKSRPKYPVRKIAFTPAFVSDFHNTPFENTRNQVLGYTKESRTGIDRNIPLGNLLYAPIQAKPDPQPEAQSDPQKEEFFSTLITTIKGHITSARLDSCNSTSKYKELWNPIKEKFEADENMEILVSKILSSNTPGVENHDSYNSVYFGDNYQKYTDDTGKPKATVNTAFESLRTPIEQTLNDIFFWICDKAKTVSAIKLTDSDLHHRGVGVCIVEYCDANKNNKKIVVKPEDKSFEKIVYGSGTESLANEFNTSLRNGALGNNFKNSEIGTLNIRTSKRNNHGSAMEFFEHQRFSDIVTNNQTDLIDNRSVKSLIAFSSLLGLADLHVENAVYSKDASKPFEIQLIDAEIGMKYLLSSTDDLALLQTAMHSGEMLSSEACSVDRSNIKRKDFESYDNGKLTDFLNHAKNKLKKAKSRIVLIPTSTLFQYRMYFLAGLSDWDVVSGKTYSSELLNAAKTYYKNYLTAIFLQEPKICKDSAEKDFAAGRIPFFELDFFTGTVMQVLPDTKIPIATYKGENGKPFLDVMIESRKDALEQEYAEIQTRENMHRLKIGFAALLCAAAGTAAGGFYYLYFGRG